MNNITKLIATTEEFSWYGIQNLFFILKILCEALLSLKRSSLEDYKKQEINPDILKIKYLQVRTTARRGYN